MNVYDNIIKETLNIFKNQNFKELKVRDFDWKMLESNEFLMGKEVAFELGDRFKDSTVFSAQTSDKDLISEDKIYLLGEDLQKIKKNTNFSRVALFNIDDIEDPNKAYIGVKKLSYERYKIIPEGYMVLSSSFQDKENVRVSKKAIKKGLDFETLGNIYIDRYKKMKGVNNVQIFFIVGDFDFVKDLVRISKKVNEVTDAFDHILKNVILDCDACPLKTICDDIEALRELHFNVNKK